MFICPPEKGHPWWKMREQGWTEPLNMLSNISDQTDQIRNESRFRSYRSQVVTSHRIKVTWDRLWSSHRDIPMTLRSHPKRSIVIEHATEIAQAATVCSPINDGPLPLPPCLCHRARCFVTADLKKGGVETAAFGKSQKAFGAKRRCVMCCEGSGGKEKVNVYFQKLLHKVGVCRCILRSL